MTCRMSSNHKAFFGLGIVKGRRPAAAARMEQIYPKGEFGFPAPYTREWFKAVESGGPLNPSFCVVGFTRIWQVYRPGSSVPSGTLKRAGTALAVYRQYSWTDRQDCRHRWGRRVSDGFRWTVGAVLSSSYICGMLGLLRKPSRIAAFI